MFSKGILSKRTIRASLIGVQSLIFCVILLHISSFGLSLLHNRQLYRGVVTKGKMGRPDYCPCLFALFHALWFPLMGKHPTFINQFPIIIYLKLHFIKYSNLDNQCFKMWPRYKTTHTRFSTTWFLEERAGEPEMMQCSSKHSPNVFREVVWVKI